MIRQIKGSCIIISGSGMCAGGRIKYHLAHNGSRPDSTILLVGYQARGTLGREIVEGARKVRIHGQCGENDAVCVMPDYLRRS